MKVRTLITQLLNCDMDSEVIIQKGSEGNGFSPLAVVDKEAVYVPETTYSGAVYSLTWTTDDVAMSEDEWEKIKRKKPCVVLSPVN